MTLNCFYPLLLFFKILNPGVCTHIPFVGLVCTWAMQLVHPVGGEGMGKVVGIGILACCEFHFIREHEYLA